MNLKLGLKSLRRRSLVLVAVLALTIAMLPTAAFASGGRAWNPGPQPQQHQHGNNYGQGNNNNQQHNNNQNYNNQNHNNHQNHNNNQNYNQPNNNQNHNNQPSQCSTTYTVQHGDTL